MAPRKTKTAASAEAADTKLDIQAKAVEVEKPLEKSDEIEVLSIIPRVSYLDSYTNDMFTWEEAGEIQLMDYSTIQNMWRNHKGYFKNLCLKPLDSRVIKKLGLERTYAEYDLLANEKNYTTDNIAKIAKAIEDATPGMKSSIKMKVKDLVVSGKIVDVNVLKALEMALDIDLITFI